MSIRYDKEKRALGRQINKWKNKTQTDLRKIMCASMERLRRARKILQCHYSEDSDGLNFEESQKQGYSGPL